MASFAVVFRLFATSRALTASFSGFFFADTRAGDGAFLDDRVGFARRSRFDGGGFVAARLDEAAFAAASTKTCGDATGDGVTGARVSARDVGISPSPRGANGDGRLGLNIASCRGELDVSRRGGGARASVSSPSWLLVRVTTLGYDDRPPRLPHNLFFLRSRYRHAFADPRQSRARVMSTIACISARCAGAVGPSRAAASTPSPRVVAAARPTRRRSVPRAGSKGDSFLLRDETTSTSTRLKEDAEEEGGEPGWRRRAFGAFAAAIVASTAPSFVGDAAPALASIPADITLAKEKAARVEREVAKDVRVLQREIAIDKEIARDEVINEAITFERFIENEPPVLVGFLALFVVNGFIGLTWALFFRETSAGPGGEFGKGIVALRKELVKGIFKFFGTVMGSYVERDGGKSR